MPELPEVETTLQGILPHLVNQKIQKVVIRNRNLRWPIPRHLAKSLTDKTVIGVSRRAKYLLIDVGTGTLIIHLGMSGRLHIVATDVPHGKHDHVDILVAGGKLLRFRDPRRFGCFLWARDDPLKHKLLQRLGVEPLSPEYNGEFLYRSSRGRRVAVKSFLMNQQVVVGIGNIYANEALFFSRIHPFSQVNRIGLARYQRLVDCCKTVLRAAIKSGGSSLKDFTQADGKPGYFTQSLAVYDKQGQPCLRCGKLIRREVVVQRATYYCPCCQR